MKKARAISPDENLEAHAAMFANRSRSKGYLFAKDRIDDAWLAWLAEDRVKQHRRGQRSAAETQQPGAGSPRDPGERRYAAWAAAAGTTRLMAQASAPTRREEENPWS
jgi:hypothetical protein